MELNPSRMAMVLDLPEAPIHHTSQLLRKHKLLVRQVGMDKFSLVDSFTYRRVPPVRAEAFWAEDRACRG